MPHRRSFLATLGAAALAAACGGRASAARADEEPASAEPSPLATPLGVQLYTVREAMQRDVADTLERVAAIGFREVEFAGYFDRTPGDVRALLDRLRLAAPSAHVPYDQLEPARWQRVIADAKIVGHTYLTVPWLAEALRGSRASWQQVAARFNEAAATARAAGLRFAYHNHDFEFQPVDGIVPFDLLLAETDPDLVDYEMDVYWTVRAGHDPLAYFARHPGRFPMLHMKDSAGAPEHRMVDVGAGTIDFAAILAAREQGGVRHLFVEHDNPADPFASIRASYAHLARLLG